MGTVIITLILLLIAALAVKSVIHRIRHGSSCCGERDAPEKKINVLDKDKSNYPYRYVISVDGMHCSNCTRRVENALNSLDGLWAKANLEKKYVSVLSKKEVDEKLLTSQISEAGYTVLSFVQE